MPHDLHPYPLDDALAYLRGQPRRDDDRVPFAVTMNEDQWEPALAVAYDMGAILLEVNDDEVPVRAYRKHRPKGGPA